MRRSDIAGLLALTFWTAVVVWSWLLLATVAQH